MKLLFPSFLSLCLALSVSFLSCQSAKTDIKGEYELSTDEMELSDEEAATMKLMGDFKLVLAEDNILKFTMMGQEIEGTYKLNGNTIDLSMQGDTETATMDGDKIIMEAQDQKLVFVKSK